MMAVYLESLPSWIQTILHKKNFTHSFWLNLIMAAIFNFAMSCIQTLCTKRTSLIHSDSPWWWQPSWILPFWIQPFCKNTLPQTLFNVTQTNSISLNLMMATILNSSILNSAILDSAILHKTLTQTISIWLKLIHSDSTWWCQPSWTLACCIQTLPSKIQTPYYLLSD